MPVIVPVQAAAAPPPNAVDCAFRELAVRVASRNLQGDAAKLALVSAGLNASACPHGARWAADCARSPDDGGGSSPSTATIGSRSVFVSPTGSDTAAGTQAAPLRTLKAAQAKVAALLGDPGPVTVHLRAGTYYEPLVIGPRDSGRPGAPVTWQAFGSEKAVISGGKRLACSWRTVTLNNATVHSCALRATDPRGFESLFVNGRRLQRARYPNGDPTIPCNAPETCIQAGYTHAASPGQRQAGVGTCPPNAQPLAGAEVSVYNGERLLSKGIVSLDAAAPARNLSVTDNPYVHDAGAFRDYQGFTGGGVACCKLDPDSDAFWL